MKKQILSLMMLVAGTSVFALNPTATIKFAFSSANGGNDNVTFVEDASFTEGQDVGMDAPKSYTITNPSVNIVCYGVVPFDKGKVAMLAAPKLEGKYIGFLANTEETDYTITFENAVYAPTRPVLYLEDVVENTLTKIEAGATYTFTCAAGAVLNDRFRIYQPFTPDEGEWYGCFMEDNKLYIYNNPYSANIVITDVTGAQVKSIIPTATPQTIDLSDLTPGNYTLSLGAGQKELVINVK